MSPMHPIRDSSSNIGGVSGEKGTVYGPQTCPVFRQRYAQQRRGGSCVLHAGDIDAQNVCAHRRRRYAGSIEWSPRFGRNRAAAWCSLRCDGSGSCPYRTRGGCVPRNRRLWPVIEQQASSITADKEFPRVSNDELELIRAQPLAMRATTKKAVKKPAKKAAKPAAAKAAVKKAAPKKAAAKKPAAKKAAPKKAVAAKKAAPKKAAAKKAAPKKAVAAKKAAPKKAAAKKPAAKKAPKKAPAAPAMAEPSA